MKSSEGLNELLCISKEKGHEPLIEGFRIMQNFSQKIKNIDVKFNNDLENGVLTEFLNKYLAKCSPEKNSTIFDLCSNVLFQTCVEENSLDKSIEGAQEFIKEQIDEIEDVIDNLSHEQVNVLKQYYKYAEEFVNEMPKLLKIIKLRENIDFSFSHVVNYIGEQSFEIESREELKIVEEEGNRIATIIPSDFLIKDILKEFIQSSYFQEYENRYLFFPSLVENVFHQKNKGKFLSEWGELDVASRSKLLEDFNLEKIIPYQAYLLGSEEERTIYKRKFDEIIHNCKEELDIKSFEKKFDF